MKTVSLFTINNAISKSYPRRELTAEETKRLAKLEAIAEELMIMQTWKKLYMFGKNAV